MKCAYPLNEQNQSIITIIQKNGLEFRTYTFKPYDSKTFNLPPLIHNNVICPL